MYGSSTESREKGKVYIVGAGPGNPKLLTLRALEVIKSADVIIYDRLISTDILKLLPEDAEKIYVGKQPHQGGCSQEEINRLLVREAKAGKKVVRLKNGDPFIFSRGGEEMEALRSEGIEYEVVPGVSSATAVPAYAGIPLTHRRFSSSVAIVTGHEDPSKNSKHVKWDALARSVDTIVILMGASRLTQIAAELLKGGLPESTPLAVIEWGTTEKQKVTRSTLGKAANGELSPNPPCIIVIGQVALLADKLSWFSATDVVN